MGGLVPELEPFSEIVEKKLQLEFSVNATDLQTARVLLSSYGTENWHREQNRVRLAILKLAGGNLQGIKQWVETAKSDYRDALAWAEYPSQMKSTKSDVELQARDLKQYQDWLDGRCSLE